MRRLDEEIEKKITHPIYEMNKLLSPITCDREQLGSWAEDIFQWLFYLHPTYTREDVFLSKEIMLKKTLLQFMDQIQSGIANPANCVASFFRKLPLIYKLLKSDLEVMYNSDPAAESVQEVLLAYPGFFAIAIHRISHELSIYKIPVIPRLLAEYAHYKTGIDIHPGATIGERFLIDHGTGVVIGGTCNIGKDVKIYQGVTLGALSVSRDHAAIKRHPTIGDRVVLYANATILGGNTVIGNDSVIGGNVWITHSIPSNSMVFHKSEIIIKNNVNFPEPLNFII